MTNGNVLENEDSYNGSGLRSLDFWGITFNHVYAFNKVVFTTGNVFGDGGWFTSGLRVQTRCNGIWIDVSGMTVTPVYPNNNTAGAHLTYAFTFNTVAGDGIRIAGVPGGGAYFTSISEFEAYYAILVDCAHATPVNTPNNTNNIAQTGTGRTAIYAADHQGSALSVMTDGALTASEDSAIGAQKSIDYWGIAFTQPYAFNKVVFTTGSVFGDGGWFTSGLRVQTRCNGIWIDATGISVSPTYPNNNTAGSYQAYTFTFNTTVADYGGPVCQDRFFSNLRWIPS
jgi:hypothetical protein